MSTESFTFVERQAQCPMGFKDRERKKERILRNEKGKNVFLYLSFDP
jgi:hypothetical protein